MARAGVVWWPAALAFIALEFISVEAGTEVLRPRGVPLIRAPMYDASKAFTCFDGSNQIPFGYVNDDYCDCHDGSDEPGTPACSQGFFHCANRGFRSVDIPSSRVNDGICDCCDGSDEFDDKITCTNECIEMGKQMREEAEKQIIALRLGFEKRQGYIETVKTRKAEKLAALAALDTQLKDLENQKAILTQTRDDAEAPETIAVQKFKEAWEATKAEREQLLEKSHAEDAFRAISADPHLLSKENLLEKLGKEGETLDEEIHEAIHRLSDITLDVFTTDMWPKIKEVYKKLRDIPAHAPTAAPTEESHTTTASADDDHLDDYEKEYDEDRHLDEENKEDDHPDNDNFQEDLNKMPEYDPETKALVDAAEKARRELKDFEKRFSDLENEKNGLKHWLENDYGPDSVFAALEGECFEYTDREYTYRVCPFDKVVQRPKDGGSDTGLGKWGSWEDNYTTMFFNDGARCWNGPARSTKVLLECGAENHVGSASEPSRCEYQMTFQTPAVCSQPPQNVSDHLGLHDEL